MRLEKRDAYLTAAQTAIVFNVASDTLTKWAKRGLGPRPEAFGANGRAAHYRIEEIERFISRHVVDPKAIGRPTSSRAA